MDFGITKKISLAYLGDKHKDDYLEFDELSMADGRKLAAIDQTDPDMVLQSFEVLKGKLAAGVITNDKTGEAQEVRVADFESIPVSIVKHCVRHLLDDNENLDVTSAQE